MRTVEMASRDVGTDRESLLKDPLYLGNRHPRVRGTDYDALNDDMQGTGAITLAATLSAVEVGGVRMRDQKLVVFGAGTAGVGIADQLRDAMIRDGASPEQATA
ncbi:malic enzyme-like NAD(P)-binding protein [Streptomyces asiaticus]